MRRLYSGYQPEGTGDRPPTPPPTTGSAVIAPEAIRLKKQLTIAQQKLVERDFEIAGLKTYIASLLARIDELEA